MFRCLGTYGAGCFTVSWDHTARRGEFDPKSSKRLTAGKTEAPISISSDRIKSWGRVSNSSGFVTHQVTGIDTGTYWGEISLMV
jgi:hypothetical protein